MKKYTFIVVACALILAVTLAAIAQQDAAAPRQGFQRNREAQQKAIADLEAGIAKLKAMQEQSAQGMQNREQSQNLSEEERAKLRETFTQRREQQTQIMQTLDNSLAILGGGRQLRTQQRESAAALQAIKDIAAEEKATKTADAIQKLMDENQKKFEARLTALGMDPNASFGGGRTRGQ
jgi:hypothetical protein